MNDGNAADIKRVDECIVHWQLRADGDEAENNKCDVVSCSLCQALPEEGGCSSCPWVRVRNKRCDDHGEAYGEWARARTGRAAYRGRWGYLVPERQKKCCALAAKVFETLQEIRAALVKEANDG